MKSAQFVSICSCMFLVGSCGKKGSDGGSDNGGDNPTSNYKPAPSGMFDPSRTLLDLSGALGFAKLESSANGQGLLLSSDISMNMGGTGEQRSSIAKVTKSRDLKNIFVNEDGSEFSNSYGRPPELYKSPTGEVYVFFPDGIYDSTKQTQGGMPSVCQIFKASVELSDLTSESATPEKLTCAIWLQDKRIDSMSWGIQGAEPTLQFDGQGRIIVRVWGNQGGGGEIIRINPLDGSTKLMVNSQLQVNKFFSTPQGGLYYTASDQSGVNYFRYVDKNGGLQQIAEGWQILFFPVPNDLNDKVIYVGPDPRKSVPANSSAQPEILSFTPSLGNEEDENRILSQVASPISAQLYRGEYNGNMNASDFRAACEAGGIGEYYGNNLGMGRIIPEKNGDYLFLNESSGGWGNFSYYPPGKVLCADASTEFQGSDCDSFAQGMVRCVDATIPTDTFDQMSAARNSPMPRAFRSTPIMRMTSAGALVPIPFPSDIQVKKVWKIGDDFFYLQSKNSVFSLKKWIDGTPTNGALGDRTLKFKFEIYSLAKSGPNELMFSGLDFSTNEYGMGYINLDTLQAEMKEDVKTKVADIVTLED